MRTNVDHLRYNFHAACDECYPNAFTLFLLRSGLDWNKSEFRNTNPASNAPDDETVFSKIALNVAVCTDNLNKNAFQ